MFTLRNKFDQNTEGCPSARGMMTCHAPSHMYPPHPMDCFQMHLTPRIYSWSPGALSRIPPQRMASPSILTAGQEGGPLQQNIYPSVPTPTFSNTSFLVGYYVPPTVEPGDFYGGMEFVWKTCFKGLFQQLPHMWTFGIAESSSNDGYIYKDMAKVRFLCQSCTHGWTSMNGLVLFNYKFEASAGCGHIKFSLKGQKCKQCSSLTFETPMWYPEEVQKVMINLYYEVAGCMYGLQTPPRIKDRRHGRPRAHHNANMCQGCHQGICLS